MEIQLWGWVTVLVCDGAEEQVQRLALQSLQGLGAFWCDLSHGKQLIPDLLYQNLLLNQGNLPCIHVLWDVDGWRSYHCSERAKNDLEYWLCTWWSGLPGHECRKVSHCLKKCSWSQFCLWWEEGNLGSSKNLGARRDLPVQFELPGCCTFALCVLLPAERRNKITWKDHLQWSQGHQRQPKSFQS